MLKLNNISKKLGDFTIENISFSVEKGDYFVLLGESGVGKTVLLEIIIGLIKADGGTIHFEGNDITKEKIQNRRIGLVYQDQSLFPHFSVKENIAYPLKCRNLKKSEIEAEVHTFATQTGITHLLNRDTETLSLGEAQRTALARTLATHPDLLLLDEPLASLDIQAKAEMRSLLRKINADGQTVIHVTHDYEEAIALAKNIAVLENRTVVQTGTPNEIFQHPKSEFVANFAGIKNFYQGELIKKSNNIGFFKTAGVEFEVATSAENGHVNLILPGEAITISKEISESSARNHFRGEIKDIENVRLGVEVFVNIGVNMAVLITEESMIKMNLKIKDKVIINFKATAAKII